MKNFQKISDGLFREIPSAKLGFVVGGSRVPDVTYSFNIYSTGSQELYDASDLDDIKSTI